MAILINAESLNLEMFLGKFRYFLVNRRVIFLLGNLKKFK